MIYRVTSPNCLRACEIALPASKSLSARALIINALSAEPLAVENVASCDDTDVMLKALKEGSDPAAPIDVHGAGTAMRFLTAYFSLKPQRRVITGSERMRKRPIGILVEALRSLGADVEYVSAEGFPPLRVGGGAMHGGEIRLSAEVSSQYVSALLMIAPLLSGGLLIKLEGNIASRPYIDMTLELMRYFGAEAAWVSENELRVGQSPYRSRQYRVESDWSAASYWYEAVALAPAGVKIYLRGLCDKSLQGDAAGRELFARLGADTKFNDTGAEIAKSGRKLPLTLVADMGGEPDLAQTFAATCCGLGVKFKFGGLANLRVKETDRIYALETELRKLGFVVKDNSDDTIYWDGERCEPQRNAVIKTYDDHRMAMSFAPLCLTTGETLIDNPEVVAKSYPDFWRDLKEAGFNVTDK